MYSFWHHLLLWGAYRAEWCTSNTSENILSPESDGAQQQRELSELMLKAPQVTTIKEDEPIGKCDKIDASVNENEDVKAPKEEEARDILAHEQIQVEEVDGNKAQIADSNEEGKKDAHSVGEENVKDDSSIPNETANNDVVIPTTDDAGVDDNREVIKPCIPRSWMHVRQVLATWRGMLVGMRVSASVSP